MEYQHRMALPQFENHFLRIWSNSVITSQGKSFDFYFVSKLTDIPVVLFILYFDCFILVPPSKFGDSDWSYSFSETRVSRFISMHGMRCAQLRTLRLIDERSRRGWRGILDRPDGLSCAPLQVEHPYATQNRKIPEALVMATFILFDEGVGGFLGRCMWRSSDEVHVEFQICKVPSNMAKRESEHRKRNRRSFFLNDFVSAPQVSFSACLAWSAKFNCFIYNFWLFQAFELKDRFTQPGKPCFI